MRSAHHTEHGHDDLIVDTTLPAGRVEVDAAPATDAVDATDVFDQIVARSLEAPVTDPASWTDLTMTPPVRSARRTLRQRLDRTQRAAARVAAIEARIAHQLARLPEGWHALHPVPVGLRASDRIHLLVGPAGVFTVDTLYHPRSNVWTNGETLWVDGHRSHELSSSRFAAGRATDVLTTAVGIDVVVRPLVVLAGSGLAKAGEPVGVEIVYLEMLVRSLKARPRVLPGATVEMIVDQARRSTTWSR